MCWLSDLVSDGGAATSDLQSVTEVRPVDLDERLDWHVSKSGIVPNYAAI